MNEPDASGPVVSLAYDYEKIAPEHRAAAMHAACQIKLAAAVTVSAAITIGEQLAATKGLLPHGQWLPWLKTEFAWSHDTADRYIGVYEMLSANSAHVRNLEGLTLSAAYVLAQKADLSTKTQALKLLASGQRVTRKMVIEMLAVPAAAELPKVKKPKAPAASEDLALIVVGIVNIHAEAKAHEPGVVAAAVSPLLRRRYREDVAALVEWLDALVEDLEDEPDAQAAE